MWLAYAYNPSVGKAEAGASEAGQPTSQARLINEFEASETVSKNKMDIILGMSPKIVIRPTHK